MQVEFKVACHTGTGRRTLKMRLQNDMNFSDCKGALFANDDAGAFYRAVALLLSEYHAKGDQVMYTDTNLDVVARLREADAKTSG